MSDLLQGVDAIIFDFGNVLIDLDYPRCINRFSEVAKKNVNEIEEMVVTAPVLQQFERGMIGPEEFRTEINKLLGTNMGESQFESIWNSMLKSISKERMDKVLKIGRKVQDIYTFQYQHHPRDCLRRNDHGGDRSTKPAGFCR